LYSGAAGWFQLTSAGNAGLGGVTPSAWDAAGAGGPVLQIKRGLLFGADSETRLIHNAYYGTGDFRYIATSVAATNYQQASGQHRWYNAPSGTAGNAISFTQAMTLDASGNLLVGTTSNSFGGRVIVSNDGTATQTSLSCINTFGSGTMRQIDFFTGTNTSRIGSIESTTSLTLFNTTSDYRLKNSIAPMTGALAKVALLKPCTYKWNADGSNGQGFIAHELAEVVPECVSGAKDAVNAKGNPEYQGIDTSFLVATLTAAIQELNAKFEAYKASHP
jgi:hypothetical protein